MSNKNWSIEKGDYKRDAEATWSYFKKKERKKRIKIAFLMLLYAMGVAAIAYFVFTFL